MKKSLIVSGVAAALLVAGCATPPPANTAAPADPAGSAPAASDFLACMVSDEGGFDDKSFNETSYNGMMNAKEALGIEVKDLQSQTASDYAKNVQAMVDSNCNIIVTVGFALGDATEAAAKANPDIDFAIVDFGYEAPADNLKGLTFDTAQPAFLAGYLAAAISKTGTVGTYGGAPFPTVTIFMDGYAQGVEHYNEVKGADVKVVGWDRASKNGSFIPGNKFSDVAGGKQLAQNLASQGADVILPVAGPASEGGLQVAQESGGNIVSMWVDSDGFESMPKYADVIPTSVGKGMDVAVEEAITASKNDNFDNEVYVGTLENGGAYLAPFHDFDSKIPAEVKAEIEKLKADIIAGTVTIES
ncbi:MAG: BMP family ABC transporter substrate-binding protein [Propionibacteriaceae bacterium]|nr:BMP family ABC transporter substrate-binding protein [Propionibacteriaceae bacterium]